MTESNKMRRAWSTALLAWSAVAAVTATGADDTSIAELQRRMLTRVPAGISVSTQRLAQSAEGRPIDVWRVAASGDREPDERVGVLLVGGVDCDVALSGDLALRVADRLLERLAANEPEAAALLRTHVLYVIPQLNPDGCAARSATPRHADRVTRTPLDEDRDGATDEDPANDLNGDGVISIMRVRDPDGAWMLDPNEPRLMKRADPLKGEGGGYRLLLEGVDDDGDGALNEDGVGGIDVDRIWPHFYQHGDPRVGVFQIGTPVARALAEFVVARRNIAVAVVYGRNDNIINVPKSDARDETEQAYRDLHPDDHARYDRLSKRYRELTGMHHSAGCDPAGALYAWLYRQRGILTIATPAWWPEVAPTTPEDAEPAVATTAVTEKAAAAPGSADHAADAEADEKHPKAKVLAWDADPVAARAATSDAAKHWLKYSDDARGGAGFLDWTAVTHPEFGTVEVGGFSPFFTTTPTESEVKSIAAREAEFLLDLLGRLPRVELTAHEVTQIG